MKNIAVSCQNYIRYFIKKMVIYKENELISIFNIYDIDHKGYIFIY